MSDRLLNAIQYVDENRKYLIVQHRSLLRYTIFILLFIACGVQAKALNSSEKLSELKHDVVTLNSDIMRLKMSLAAVKHEQLTILLQLNKSPDFELYNIKLRLNSTVVVDFDYSDREVSALENQGVQRLYVGKLTPGIHQVTAFLTGTQSDGNIYKRGAMLKLIKSEYGKTLLVNIVPSIDSQNVQLLLVDLPL
jgi:hypothetical protein